MGDRDQQRGVQGAASVQAVGVRAIRYLGRQKCLDLEVDHPDHNFLCNGICVSNSHATAYGATCSLSTYLKFKHPLEFATVLLNCSREEPAPFEEIAAIQRELHYFGIQLLPPDILKSAADFTIEGANIRYGLGSIRGVSDQTIGKVLAFRDHFATGKFACFEAMRQASINIGVQAALVLSGCLQSFGKSRLRLTLEAQIYNVFTDKERASIQLLTTPADGRPPEVDPNLDITDLLKLLQTRTNEKGRPLLKASRLETIKKKIAPYIAIYKQNTKNPKLANYYFERKFCGYAYSSTLKSAFIETCPDLISITEMQGKEIDDLVHVMVIVGETRQGISKKKKTRWMRVAGVDEGGSTSVMCFNDMIDGMLEVNGGQPPQPGSIVYVRGVKKQDAIFASIVSVQDSMIYTRIADLKCSP